jgi:hypothetical protein
VSQLPLVVLLAALSACAGWTLGAAVIARRTDLGLVGGLLLLARITVSRVRAVAEGPLSSGPVRRPGPRESHRVAVQPAPRLGELLVYRYQWVSRRDLDGALAHQQHTGRQLGEILTQARVISAEKLTRALLEQRVLKGDPRPSAVPENWTGRRDLRRRT